MITVDFDRLHITAGDRILDIGCGPGMQTLELARLSKGTIIALDTYQPFLDKLHQQSEYYGLQDQITCVNQSMEKMDFAADSF